MSLPSPVVSETSTTILPKQKRIAPPTFQATEVVSAPAAPVASVAPPKKTLMQRSQECTQRWVAAGVKTGAFDTDLHNDLISIIDRTSDAVTKVKLYFSDVEKSLKRLASDASKAKKSKKEIKY